MAVAKIRKSNRVIEIPEEQVDSYLQRGYDQIDENGEVIRSENNSNGISQDEHEALQKENADLKAQLENKDAAYAELEEKAKDFAEKGKQLQEENNRLKNKNK